MKSWLSDEEKAAQPRDRWLLRVEAWAIGLAYGVTSLAGLRGWLPW
jgi:hypothetical protein